MRRALTAAVLCGMLDAARAEPPAVTLAALAPHETLLLFSTTDPGHARRVSVTGCSGALIGLDLRPSDRQLYGVTDTNDIVRIDATSGRCTPVSTLTVPFNGAARSGIDFNPQLDRLRLESADAQNLRAHPTLGATATDTALAYASGDANAGRRPRIAGAAYTNAVANAPTTRLFAIDADADVLVLQDPPNDGTLTTIGALGIDAAPESGFEIVTTGDVDQAWLATAGTLYRVDLATGHATAVGAIAGGAVVVSLALVPDGDAR